MPSALKSAVKLGLVQAEAGRELREAASSTSRHLHPGDILHTYHNELPRVQVLIKYICCSLSPSAVDIMRRGCAAVLQTNVIDAQDASLKSQHTYKPQAYQACSNRHRLHQ